VRYEPFDWYATPRFYDIVFDVTTASEADFVAAVYDRHALRARSRRRPLSRGGEGRQPRCLEAACGTGRLLLAMAERGFEVEGFDASEGMVRYARRRLPHAHIWRDLMQSFQWRGRYDCVFNLLSTFRYLSSDQDASDHLNRVADALVVGGVYVLGLHTSDYDYRRRRRERWVGERGGVEVVCNIQSWPADRASRTEPARSRMKVTDGGQTRGYETAWDFRTYDLEQLHDLIASEPRLQLVATYGFEHDPEAPRALDDGRDDHVLVLRRH